MKKGNNNVFIQIITLQREIAIFDIKVLVK